MRYIRPMSHPYPRKAQFEPVLEIISIVSSLLNLLVSASEIFGFEIPSKSDDVA